MTLHQEIDATRSRIAKAESQRDTGERSVLQ
jgi:hypothetical protein